MYQLSMAKTFNISRGVISQLIIGGVNYENWRSACRWLGRY